jgi:DNA invertase Pin-like site-specific DNA recombinase/ribosomal protein L37AE/L43A
MERYEVGKVYDLGKGCTLEYFGHEPDKRNVQLLRRFSSAKSVKELQALGLERQQQPLPEGFHYAYVITEPDRSGWKRGVARPGLDKALELLLAREADGTVVVDFARLTRRQWVLERWLEECYLDRPQLDFIVVEDRTINLSTPEGIKAARAAVTAAENYASFVSQTQKRRLKQRKAQGLALNNTRAFGWDRDGNGHEVPRPKEQARLVEAIAEALKPDGNMSALVRRWEAEGVRTTEGNVFTATNVGRMIRSPRMAGYAVHRCKGTCCGQDKRPEVQLVAVNDEGEAIVAQHAEHGIVMDDPYLVELARVHHDGLGVREAVLRVYGARSRSHVSTKRRYALSGVFVCEECNKGFCGGPRKNGGFWYGCPKCGRKIDGPLADKAVSALILAAYRLAGPVATPEADPWPRQDERDLLDAAKRQAEADKRAKVITPAAFYATLRDLNMDLAELEADEAAWLKAHPRPLPVGVDILTDADELEGDELRAQALRYWTAIEVGPALVPRKFDADRLKPVPRKVAH